MAASVFVARLRGARCWTGCMQFANNLRLLLAIKINFIISICLSVKHESYEWSYIQILSFTFFLAHIAVRDLACFVIHGRIVLIQTDDKDPSEEY
jgi:hypothetical protein